MTDFAPGFETFAVSLAANETQENRFGPCTPGDVFVTIECWATGNAQRRAPQTNAGSGGGGGGGGGGGSLPQSAFKVDIVNSAGSVLATGTAPLTYAIPVPHLVLASLSAGDKLRLRVTNLTVRAYGNVYVSYTGNRPVVRQTIDLDAVNQFIERVLADSRPITVLLENRFEQTPLIPVIPLENSFGLSTPLPTVQVEKTWLVGFPDPRLNWQWGKPELSLGMKIVDRRIESTQLTAKMTVHDGRLALKAHLEFGYGATVYVKDILERATGALKGWAVSTFLGLDTATLKTFSIDVFFTMGDMSLSYVETPPNACEISVVPRIALDGVDPYLTEAFSGVVTSAFANVFEPGGLIEKFGAAPKVQKAAQEIWRLLSHFLLGADPDMLLSAHVPSIELAYPGNAPFANLVLDQPAPTPPQIPDIGALANVDHIVVLMMENRSFDQMLGFLSLPVALGGSARTDVDGLTGKEFNFDPAFRRVDVFPLNGTLFGFEPPHSFADVKEQRGGQTVALPAAEGGSGSGVHVHDPGQADPTEVTIPPMGGFVRAHARKLAEHYTAAELADTARGAGAQPGDVMGYHVPANVKMHDFFAEQYTVCDRWFAAHPGNTWPNRFVTLCGDLARTADGKPEIGIPPIDEFVPVHTKTIFDYLTEAGVAWRYYEHDICMLRLFANYTLGHPNIVKIDDSLRGLAAAARDGTLPPVTFIDPDFSDMPPGNDDAPPSDIKDGQNLIKLVYDALSSSTLWPKTLFVIVYDEHGGFYDHVEPRAVADPNDPEYVAPMFTDPDVPSGPEHIVHYRGMRVPAFVISPLVDPKTVSHTTFDHTSIIKTIVTRFLRAQPPALSERYARANGLGALLTRATPRAAVPSPRLSTSAGSGLNHLPGDFHTLVKSVRTP